MGPGTWADWVTAVFTGGGLGAAVYQLRLARRDQERARTKAEWEERERRASFAGMVGLTVSVGPVEARDRTQRQIDFVALNSSPYPISNVVAVIAADEGATELVLGTILPGDRVEHSERVSRADVPFRELHAGVTLLFTDVFGQHWSRTPEDLESRDYAARTC